MKPLALFIALALAFPAGAADDAEPRNAPAIDLEADSIDSSGGITRARGKVKATINSYQLCAGNLRYDRNSGDIEAREEVELGFDDIELYSDRIRYNTNSGEGDLAQFSSKFADTDLHISGSRAQWSERGLSADNTVITSCPADSRDWLLHANNVETISDRQELVFRDTTLQIKDIPILYFPYGRLYYGKEKRSGFLTPEVQLGSNSGFGLSAPYYWHLADNYDLTTTPNYRDHHGIELKNEFRFLTRHSSGSMQVASALLTDSGRGREKIDYHYQRGAWRFKLQADNVSDDDYLRDYVGGDSNATRILPRAASLLYETDRYYASAEINHYKNLDEGGIATPFHAVPQLEVGGNGGSDRYDWDGSWQYSRFEHSSAAGGARHVWRGNARRYYHLGNISLSPAAGIHAAAYAGQQGGFDGNFITPYARLDAERNSTGLFATASEYDILRLRASYVLAPPQKRQNAAPLYDSDVRQQTSENLFEWNRFVGNDRASDANFLAYGGSYHLSDSGKRELFFLGMAQRYNLRDAEIVLADEATPPDQGFGNILLDSRLRLGDTWRAAAAAEWDTQKKSVEQFYIELKAAFADNTLMQFKYQANEDETLVAGAGAPLADWLEVAAKTDYIMDEDRFARSELAVRIHDDCRCWSISFTVKDTVIAEDDNDTEFTLGVSFTGLGHLGNNYESLLNKLR